MILKEKISQDFKSAFKAREELKVSVLRLLNSAIKNKEGEKRMKLIKQGAAESDLESQSQLQDEEVLAVIASEVKRRKDSVKQYTEGGRPELAAREEAEIKILEVYLPEQLGEEELRKIIQESVKKADAGSLQDLGKVMKILRPRVRGKSDGDLVNKIVREELEK